MRISITLLVIIASLGAANPLKEVPCKTHGERCGGVGYGDCCEGLTCIVGAVAAADTSIATSILTCLSTPGGKHFSWALPLVESTVWYYSLQTDIAGLRAILRHSMELST